MRLESGSAVEADRRGIGVSVAAAAISVFIDYELCGARARALWREVSERPNERTIGSQYISSKQCTGVKYCFCLFSIRCLATSGTAGVSGSPGHAGPKMREMLVLNEHN